MKEELVKQGKNHQKDSETKKMKDLVNNVVVDMVSSCCGMDFDYYSSSSFVVVALPFEHWLVEPCSLTLRKDLVASQTGLGSMMLILRG